MTELPGLTAEVRERVVRWAGAQEAISALYVFGSRATGISRHGGSFRADSDLDVAIYTRASRHMAIGFELLGMQSDRYAASLGAVVPLAIDLEVVDISFEAIPKYLRESGVCIYGQPIDWHAHP